MLKGYKTYLVALVWLGLKLLDNYDIIPSGFVDDATSILMPLGLAALRHGVTNERKKTR